MTVVSLATVKSRLSEYIASVQSTHERVTITKNGAPAAVLISPEDLESLEETLAILTDPETVAAIEEGQAALARGDVHGLDEVAASVARRRARGAG